MVNTTTVVGGATGDYAGNHGDTSPGSYGVATDYYYPGNGTGVIITSRGVCNADGTLQTKWLDRVTLQSIYDGTSNTFMAGEMHFTQEGLNQVPFNGPLFNGDELVAHTRIGGPGVPILTAHDEPGTLFGFGSWHPGSCNFVFTDGSTQSVNNYVDTVLLGNLCHRDDGNITRPEF